jgi:hypothetical protein
LTVDQASKPVLLSLNDRGFYVLHYSAIPEESLTRISFELVDPNTGEGATADALVDPKLIEDLNQFNSSIPEGRVFLIWIDTSKGEVSWQIRKTEDVKF